ncbi:MAG TPA: RNA polymerase sigma-54 factor, partial [Deltaproteobacteria bacterium]|nr:RNA polymerase sigma-54 factor [Deltaproteobacteria bacterium]
MMALELRQQLKLSQQLIMTPQLQQAIKLLQLSRLELLDTIHQELEINPLLEETQEELPTEQDAELETLTTEETPFQEVQLSEKMREDFDWEGYLEEYNTSTPVLVEIDPNQEWPSFDSRLTEPTTLEDHLIWQLRLSDFSEQEQEIGACIIGNLNNDGYLDATIEEITEMSGADPSKVEQVLGKIQNFDPTGVAARDLRECLLVQAKNMQIEDK